uniref:Aldehyde dehydrogenase domain-containing protein n=1 Tax=Timema poppense TaxID=170557 RepID=A0A7R9H060_TIMPO|nr:unnamed protein product [Timema poppensis]
MLSQEFGEKNPFHPDISDSVASHQAVDRSLDVDMSDVVVRAPLDPVVKVPLRLSSSPMWCNFIGTDEDRIDRLINKYSDIITPVWGQCDVTCSPMLLWSWIRFRSEFVSCAHKTLSESEIPKQSLTTQGLHNSKSLPSQGLQNSKNLLSKGDQAPAHKAERYKTKMGGGHTLHYSSNNLHKATSRMTMHPVRTLTQLNLIQDKAFVGGVWKSAASGKTFNVINPSSGTILGAVPDMDESDTKAAIEAAHKAFLTWGKTTGKERSSILRNWFDLLVKNENEIARIVSSESGKAFKEAIGEVAYGNSFIEWFSEEARRIHGEVISSPVKNKEMVLIHQPIGVAALITPWNFPLAMITRKAGAALAAGCTCVVKPAEDTPLTALAIANLAAEAGIPPGVFNVITSDRQHAPSVGKQLCEHPLVAGISFTGSTDVFRESITISSACNRLFRKLFLAPDTLAILPKGGYRCGDRQSVKAIKWLVYLQKTRPDIHIQHAFNGREIEILGRKVDGYCESKREIF